MEGPQNQPPQKPRKSSTLGRAAAFGAAMLGLGATSTSVGTQEEKTNTPAVHQINSAIAPRTIELEKPKVIEINPNIKPREIEIKPPTVIQINPEIKTQDIEIRPPTITDVGRPER